MFEAVIGLEIHAELKTRTKMFCACENLFGAPPNTRCCPVCLALPGALPTVNAQAVALAVRAGIALHTAVQTVSYFDRKQYFYPDLPKAYQITQFYHPLCQDGFIELAGAKKVRIRELHLEEDAGKLLHENGKTLIDLNRCGVPLIEIVTEPDLRSAKEARECMTRIHALLVSLGVTDGKMQEGAMRADVNVSLRAKGAQTNGERVELKNVSGFREIEHAAEHEIARQTAILSQGGRVSRETRRWDERERRSLVMRSKEQLPDYRYFPEPDLPPLTLSPSWIESMRKDMPPTPDETEKQISERFGCGQNESNFLLTHQPLLEYSEKILADYPDAKAILSWMLGDWLAYAREKASVSAEADENEQTQALFYQLLPPRKEFIALLDCVKEGKLTRGNAKTCLFEAIESGDSIAQICSKRSLWTLEPETDALSSYACRLLDDHQAELAAYQAGKTNLFSFFMGDMVRAFPKQSPKEIKAVLQREMEKRNKT